MNLRIVWLCLFLLTSLTLEAARLQSIEVKQSAGKTSLFFSLDGAIVHKVFMLTNPNRVIVDFEKTDLSFNLKQLRLNSNLIKLVRSGHPNPKTLRLVFEVTDPVMLHSNPGKPSPSSRHAFSLDLSANHKPQAISLIKEKIVQASSIQRAPQYSRKNVVVVLDPGHGGKDPGAIGPRRSAEKNVTLAIAVKLKKLIDSQPGMKAVLTRNGDYYVGLRERLKIARKYNGDVFISIHADAFINQQSNGASVFALSQRGATSEAARWLAEKENYSELGGVNLRGLDDQSGLVRTVLIDLSQTATIAASLNMGEGVLRGLKTITSLHNHKVEQARFMVLKSPDIPSILIETGFISNPREESNLTNPGYQARMSQSIFQGLKQYFWDYPPHGPQVAHEFAPASVPAHVSAFGKTTIHIVHSGESLTKIAAKYKVSPAALQAANHMTVSMVKIGQRLVVPSPLS